MCIRDRPTVEPLADARCKRIVDRRMAQRAGDAHAGQRVGACLLYTSDAADERSSVDLGGRRIIKKKNKVPA